MAWWTINRMWPCLMLTIDSDDEDDVIMSNDGDDGDVDSNSFHNSGYRPGIPSKEVSEIAEVRATGHPGTVLCCIFSF